VPFDILAGVVKVARGFTLLDLVVVLALLALLVWVVRLDHPRSEKTASPATTTVRAVP
jgi:Tfp pilus assembly protein FimT